jgi:hypothetical protein
LTFGEQSFECLHEEFLDYKALQVEDLPVSALEEASRIMSTVSTEWMLFGII